HGRALCARQHAPGRLERRHFLHFGDRPGAGEELRQRVVDGKQSLVHASPRCLTIKASIAAWSFRFSSGSRVSTFASLATATMCWSLGCSSGSPGSARQTSSLGIGANLKPSTSSRSHGDRCLICSSNDGSGEPRSSCISTQRRDDVTRISLAPAWRCRYESLPG